MVKKLAVVAVALTVALVGAFLLYTQTKDSSEFVAPLSQQGLPGWSGFLGGEDPIKKADIEALNSTNIGVDGPELKQLRDIATTQALSALTAVPYGMEGYDAPSQSTVFKAVPRCENVNLLAESVNAVEYEGTLWARVLVLYSGKCSDGTFTRSAPGVEYVYAQRTPSGWLPVRSWQTPGSGQERPGSSTDPAALVELGPCGVVDSEVYLARPRVAVSFQRLCQAARQDQVVLVVSDAYRTKAEQQELFESAVEAYGSVEEAAKFVSPADENICTSRHCTGLAVKVEPDSQAVSWLAQVSSCLLADGTQVNPDSKGCPKGSRPVSNAESFGFATPPTGNPGYLEYVLPAGLGSEGKAEPDCQPYGQSTPAIVASVFRCRLAEAGVPPFQVERAVASALVVARCASGMNPQATVFNGAYATTPKPGTDRLFPLGGLFGLAPADSAWQSGSMADPVAAANYAAKLWLVDRSFSRFFCATGADPQLSTDPVLPEFGGPELPAWAQAW